MISAPSYFTALQFQFVNKTKPAGNECFYLTWWQVKKKKSKTSS